LELNLAENLIRQVSDSNSGRLAIKDRVALDVALGGAVLLDLSLKSRIDSDQRHLWLADDSPTGDGVNDAVLELIAKEGKPRGIDAWVYRLYGDSHALRIRLLTALARKNIVRPEIRKLFGLIPLQRYKPQNAEIERAVKRRIMSVLCDCTIPSPEDVALGALCEAANLFPSILAPREPDACAERIHQVASMELIAQSVCSVIGEVYIAMNQSAF